MFEQNEDVSIIGEVRMDNWIFLSTHRSQHTMKIEIYYFLQLMEWPIARGINGDEKVEIQILAHNR